MNPVKMLEQLRNNIGEATAQNWQDEELLRHLDGSQAWLQSKLATLDNGMFRAEYSFDLVSDQELYKLPPRLMKINFVEYTIGSIVVKIKPATEMHRSAYDLTGQLGYYARGRRIGIVPTPNSALTGAIKVYHAERLPELEYGTMQSVTKLAATANATDDYYNGCELVIYGGTGTVGDRAFISDYTGSTQTFTLDSDGWTEGSTPDSTTTYYIVCKIPEEYQNLMILRATIHALAKDEDQATRFKGIFKEEYENMVETYGQATEPEFVKEYA